MNIIITGDFCPHLRIEELCLNESYEGIYNDCLPFLKDKHISITNLECPLTNISNPIEKHGPNLIAHTKCIEGIKYGGFDVVTLANNHILDQEESGLERTLSICENAGIKTSGAGENLDKASNPTYISIKRKKIAVLNFTENEFSIAQKNKAGANPLDIIENYYQIKEAKEKADIILLIVHGGHEHFPLPSPRMVKTCRFFASLGVTAIVNHHTHCVSGYEVYNNVPIFYSLGNFIFDWKYKKQNSWYEGFFVKLTINESSVDQIVLFPYYQCKNNVGLALMNEEEKSKFLEKIESYSEIIRNANLLENQWLKHCDSRKIDYLSNLLSLNKFQRQMLKRNIFSNLFLKKRKLLNLINLIRCESHREMIIDVIENIISKK